MRKLDLKIPPVAVAAFSAALSWTLSTTGPAFLLSTTGRIVLTAILALSGSAIALAGIATFLRAQTTVNPHRPQHTSTLVTGGIYRFTRNPMYLGILLVLAAWSVFLDSWLAFAPLLLFVLYLTRFQIEPEERALTVAFGSQYTAYRTRVRRWI